VRFACPGQYTVRLVVKDQLTAASTPAFRTIVVGPGASAITAGADASRDHACSGDPLLCTVSGGPIALSASATMALGSGLTYHWEVEPPPGLALDAQRRVTFDPGPDVPSPTMSLETDGTAISGDWIFRVEVKDASGALGSAAQRVTVGNQPPVVTGSVSGLSHTFDPVGSLFTASGKIAVSVTDPDGDPLSGRAVSWHHTGDGAGTFGGQDLPDGITATATVLYAQPADAAFLIGPDVERTVTLSVQDVNGAVTSQDWPVQIQNRPPVLVSSPSSVSVPHSFDGTYYLASAQLGTWVDPDGDPMVQDGSTGDPSCPDISYANGVAVVRCSLLYAGVPAVGAFGGWRSVVQRPRDPWDAAAPFTTPLEIKDRPPRLLETAVGPSGRCHDSGSCCWASGGQCGADNFRADPAAFSVGSFVVDDDGDPLQVLVTPTPGRVTVTPRQQLCAGPDCAFDVDDPGQGWTCAPLPRPPAPYFTVVVRDGSTEVTGKLTFSGSCAY
jgi:hypothetical protein